MSMILITGATGYFGRHVVSQLLSPGAIVWALSRNPKSAGLLGEVVRGDLYLRETLHACLVWPFFTAEVAPAFLEAVAKHARRILFLSSESVGDDLEQQTDMITARTAEKLAA
jgi:NAD(P)-dependent dehydrogenase (short-subunit alcohol dehydrogenase family)